MSSRAPSSPPLIDGYTYVQLLGSGGFADVFKYQQLRPRREVALKVLLRGLGADAQRQFEHEANLMALLSNHPSIVSIHASGVAPDGRPYLVMESCQPRHLGARIRSRPLSVGRALQIGIQVAGAVETAHRLGILHRDIKPANILFTEFGRPALTDFGISVVDGGQTALAFSAAWAPPEQIENRPMGPSGDVYALAGTVWAMLVGHSPFDAPGDNSSLAVASRVRTVPLAPTGRADVPESLERVLRTAMAKQPEQRYASALEFARALQGVQAELHESVTTIEVRDERLDEDDHDLTESGTRVTGFALVDPDVTPDTASGWFDVSDARGTRQTAFTADTGATDPTGTGEPAPVLLHGRGSRPATDPLEFTGPAVPRVPEDDTFVAGAGVTPGDVPDGSPRAPASRLPLALLASAVVVVGGLTALWVGGGLGGATVSTATPTPTTKALDPLGEQVAPPADLKGRVSGKTVVFTWTNPDPRPGDRFSYRPVLVDREVALVDTTTPKATIAKQVGPTCLEVEVTRANGQFSSFTKGCVP